MEQPDNSLQSSLEECNYRFEERKKQLFLLLIKRCSVYFFKLKGKDGGRDVWRSILVDCDKKEKYLQVIQKEHPVLDFEYYGKIIASSFYNDASETKCTIKFCHDLEKQLFVFQLPANHEIYYVLCDADKRSKITSSRTAEEVERCGRILYSSMDEDPPEALWDVLERGFFGLSGETSFVFCRRGVEIARGGDSQIVRDFLEAVGNVDWTDVNGWTMLHHAAHCGDLNTIRILKDMNANTQVRDMICGRKPIHIAAREGHTRAVELLLIESVDDVDKSGWTPLHYAAWKGESDTVKYLISKEANPEIIDRCFGKKPIHVAAMEGHTNIVQIILDKDANIDNPDSDGATLIYYSAAAGRFETTKFLIERGANVDIGDNNCVKPIHVSLLCDHVKLAELLISHGADIESRTSAGATPLHYAALLGGIGAVQMLTEKGANLMATNNEGETPFDSAMKMQHLENASYIAERLCEMFQDEAKYSEALEIYKKLFKLQKEQLGYHHDTFKTQYNIALVLYEQCKYEESLETFNVILNKRQDILDPNNFDILCIK